MKNKRGKYRHRKLNKLRIKVMELFRNSKWETVKPDPDNLVLYPLINILEIVDIHLKRQYGNK